MTTIEIPIPRKRLRCAVCNKSLMRAGKYHDLHICATNGAVVLVCSEHTHAGDVLVQAIRLYAKLNFTPPKPAGGGEGK